MGDGLENVVYPFKKWLFWVSHIYVRFHGGLVIDKLFGSFGHDRT